MMVQAASVETKVTDESDRQSDGMLTWHDAAVAQVQFSLICLKMHRPTGILPDCSVSVTL